MRIVQGASRYVLDSGWRLEIPDGPGRPPLVVALHGWGEDAGSFAERMRALEVRDAALLFPGGPIPVEIPRGDGTRRVGGAWYAYDGDQARFRRDLERIEAYLVGLIEEVTGAHRLDAERLLLCGYSMGAWVAGFLALRRRPLPLGLVLLAGRLKHEFLEKEIAAARGLPVLAVRGAADRRFPLEQAAQGLELLGAAGAVVEQRIHPGGHGLPAPVLREVGVWMRRCLVASEEQKR